MAIRTTHDIVPDSPTNVFATLNPLDKANSPTISDGSLSYIHATANLWATCRGTLGFNSGRYYWEGRASGSSASLFGYCDNFNIYANGGDTLPRSTTSNLCVSWYGSVALLDTETGTSNPWSGGGFGNTDVVMICVDYDLGYVWLGKNGTWVLSGDPDNNSNPVHTFSNSEKITIYPFASASNNTGFYFNFGQDPSFGGNTSPSTTYTDANGIGSFYYQPPTGALALCTANLPDPDIDPKVDDLPEDYFKAKIYSGTGTPNTSNLNGLPFKPDLVWIKSRTTTNGNNLFDSVRGAGWILSSNAIGGEGDNTAYMTGFTNDGVSFGSVGGDTNASGTNYVAWCFRAGGAPTADNSNTSGAMTANSVSVDGTLQSSYTPAGSPTIYPKRMSVNTKAGFSIIKYTGNGSSSGATIPHGLNSAPDLVIVKCTTTAAISTNNWHVYHRSAGTGYLYLNLDWAYDSTATRWNSTNPNSQLIYLGGDSNYFNVENNINFICYAWHSVAGYSAFGSYTGNGSADGPFVYTGFKPAWVMIKKYEGGTHRSWLILDSTRDDYNPCDSRLYPNTSAAEFGNEYNSIDILSNGFKPITASYEANESSGHKYIYAAFAEQPFKYANAR